MRTRGAVARAVAAAFLDVRWDYDVLLTAAADVLDVRPSDLGGLVRAVRAAYRDPPRDRRRELAAFLGTLTEFNALWDADRAPPITRLPVPRCRMVDRRWPVPVLHSVADLADWAELTLDELEWLADTRSLERGGSSRAWHYDRDWVFSRRGTVRLLERPRSRTKALHRRLLHEVVGLMPCHEAAHGFRPGRSVRTFAEPHCGHAVVLRVDLAAFFASITAGRVYGVLRAMGYPEPVAHLLCGVTTTVAPRAVIHAAPQALRDEDLDGRRRLLGQLAAPHLPQGAPTSPALANLVAFRLDTRLAGLSRANDATYTRYADDLAFSLDGDGAARRARRLLRAVRAVIRQEGFHVNDAKVSLATSGQRQQLCGIIVNRSLAVDRRQRDELRAILHNCRVHGPASQNHGDHPDFRAYLLGRIAWVSSLNVEHGQRLRASFDRIEW